MILDGKTDKESLLEILEKKRQAWQETMNSARYKEECLGEIIQNVQASCAAQKVTEMTEEERAWLLVKMVCIEDVRTQKTLSEAVCAHTVVHAPHSQSKLRGLLLRCHLVPYETESLTGLDLAG